MRKYEIDTIKRLLIGYASFVVLEAIIVFIAR